MATKQQIEQAKESGDEKKVKAAERYEEHLSEAESKISEAAGEIEEKGTAPIKDAIANYDTLAAQPLDIDLTGQVGVGTGAAGHTLVTPPIHAQIESDGGTVIDPELSGHASIFTIDPPTTGAPPPGPWQPSSEEETQETEETQENAEEEETEPEPETTTSRRGRGRRR